MTLVLHPKGPQIEPRWRDKVFIHFFALFEVIEVRNLVKIGTISAVFLSHETTLFKSSLSSYISPIKAYNRTVPEIGQKLTFVYFYYAQKRKKLIFFKIRRSNLKILI